MPPSLQVHLPISPTPSFFAMVELFVLSIRRLGGRFADARVIVSVGEDCEPFDLAAACPRATALGVEWRWADREQYRRRSYFATGLDRWAEPFTSDYVLMADADIVIAKDFSDVTERLAADGVAGVIATGPPWTARGGGDDRRHWCELFRAVGLGAPPFDMPIPGHGIFYPATELALSPPYYNYGFVMGTRDAMNRVRECVEADHALADDALKTDLCAQVGLTLSIIRQRLQAVALPVRYNFWSCPEYVEFFPDDFADLRVLHYLRGPFQKHRDNETLEATWEWAARHAGSEDIITARVAQLLTNAIGGPP